MKLVSKKFILTLICVCLSLSIILNETGIISVYEKVYAATNELIVNINNKVYTNDDLYSLYYNNTEIDLGQLPIFPYDGILMVRANKLSEALDLSYNQTSDNVVIQYGNISVNFTFNSKIAYVNGKKILIDAPLLLAKEQTSAVSLAVVPLEFTLSALGFKYDYDLNNKRIYISRTNYAGNGLANPYITSLSYDFSQKTNEVTTTVSNNRLFNWTISPENEYLLELSSKKYLTQVEAFHMEHSDAIVLYGIDKSDVNAFMDGLNLIINIDNTGNLCADCFYDSEDSKYLKLCLLSGKPTGTAKLKIQLEDDDRYYFTENDNNVAVHITKDSVNDPQAYLIETQTVTANDNQNDYSLPDDKLIIPLPANTTLNSIKDYDNYLNYSFIIYVKGNHVQEIRNKGIINPYSLIEGYSISYNSNTDYTSINFDTKLICAYKYELLGNNLIVTVGRPNELYDKIVLLDAGHGGTDPGAIYNGVQEKDLNFKILNTYCKEYFANSNIKAYFTRETDVLISLDDRAKFATEVCADFFVSLHMNSNTSSAAYGTQVFYNTNNNTKLSNGLNSATIADILVNDLSAALETRNRKIDTQNYYVVRYNKVPAVLIELGFMTNSSDFNKLTSEKYQKIAAKTIYDSIKKIFDRYY